MGGGGKSLREADLEPGWVIVTVDGTFWIYDDNKKSRLVSLEIILKL